MFTNSRYVTTNISSFGKKIVRTNGSHNSVAINIIYSYHIAKTHLGPSQTSIPKFLASLVNGYKMSNIFVKSSIINVWQSPKYLFVLRDIFKRKQLQKQNQKNFQQIVPGFFITIKLYMYKILWNSLINHWKCSPW